MKWLNCTIEEPVPLNKGDIIDISVVHVFDERTVSIRNDAEKI